MSFVCRRSRFRKSTPRPENSSLGGFAAQRFRKQHLVPAASPCAIAYGSSPRDSSRKPLGPRNFRQASPAVDEIWRNQLPSPCAPARTQSREVVACTQPQARREAGGLLGVEA